MSDEYAALEDGLAALDSINDESMIVFLQPMVASVTTRANLTLLLADWDEMAGLHTCETPAAAIIVCSATVKLSPEKRC